MTPCDRCNGVGWVIVVNNGYDGARMCNCRARSQQPAGKPLIEEIAGFLVAGMCQILDFAPEDVGQAIVVAALMDMCSTEEDARFVVNRACSLYTKWGTCGIRGLRQILCSLHVPKDGLVISSTEAYPDGIPSLRRPEPGLSRLPPGLAVSADLDCERAVLRLAESKAIGGGGGTVPQIPIQRPVTESDIRKAEEEYKERKKKGER